MIEDDNMLTPMAEPLVRKFRHRWFGGFEIAGYASFIVLAVVVYSAASPRLLPNFVNRWPVSEAYIDNAVEGPDGMISVYIWRKKLRVGTPVSIDFAIVNGLSTDSNAASTTLPFRGNVDCSREITTKPINNFDHEVGDIWYNHFCFKMLRHIDPDQSYSIDTTITHSAWPWIAPRILKVHAFTPRKVDEITYPYGDMPLSVLTAGQKAAKGSRWEHSSLFDDR